MKHQYIKSVIELLKAGEKPEAVFTGLEKTLKNRGHLKLHDSILQGVYRVLSSSTNSNVPSIVVARDSDLTKLKSEIKAAFLSLEADQSTAQIEVDPTITGGYIASFNHKVVDASYKSKLLKWYRVAITNQ